MPYYENVFIARQDISPAQVDTLAEVFEKVITDTGGSIAKRENWGLRTMAYKISKNRKGHYVLLNIDAPPSALQEMERQMRINEDVLRYLTIRVDEFEDAPSVMMRNKDRNDRPRQSRDPTQEVPPDLKKTEPNTSIDKTSSTESNNSNKMSVGDETLDSSGG